MLIGSVIVIRLADNSRQVNYLTLRPFDGGCYRVGRYERNAEFLSDSVDYSGDICLLMSSIYEGDYQSVPLVVSLYASSYEAFKALKFVNVGVLCHWGFLSKWRVGHLRRAFSSHRAGIGERGAPPWLLGVVLRLVSKLEARRRNVGRIEPVARTLLS